MVTLKNDILSAAIKTKGAELCSIIKGQREYLWQGDSKFWGRHAPNLFPIVGKLKGNKYAYRKNSYSLKQHGFARDSEFQIKVQTADSVTLTLKSSKKTERIYPFKFEFYVTHFLDKNRMKTKYQVLNSGNSDMFFSVGGHPAFNCPMEKGHERSDYRIVLVESNEEAKSKILENGFIGKREKDVLIEGKYLDINDSLFDEDALIFDPNVFRKATLMHKESGKEYLSMHIQGFPSMGVWSKNQESPFVCIEPWFGIADYHDHNGELEEKKGIIRLEPQKTFDCQYAIEIF